MAKLRLGMYSAAGCGGCDVSLLDVDEHLLDIVNAADIVFWPAALDFKYADVEALPDDSIDVCFVNGAMRNAENNSVAELLRAKSKVLVAYGACAAFGGVPGLANLFSANDMLERAFGTESTTASGDAHPSAASVHANGQSVGLPGISGTVRALADIVEVDYVLPGCAPATDRVWEVCQAIVTGSLPPAPAIVGAGTKVVCNECSLPRRGTLVSHFVRSHQIVPEPAWCLLEQGVICMGPATRSGCGGQCTSVLMPCRGCYGCAGDSIDQGASMLAVIGTLIDSEDEQVILDTIAEVVDPAGTFYSFTLPTSLLGHARAADPTGEVCS